MHIEVVWDLSSDSLLAVLYRFVSRQGIPSDIYSDNGIHFKGTEHQNLYTNAIQSKWHFNPPATLYFGGIWEAVVKSIKYNLKWVFGDQILTSEELFTLSIRIEALLNSRSLTSILSDLNDIYFLSSGNFLIGHPIVDISDSNISFTNKCIINIINA